MDIKITPLVPHVSLGFDGQPKDTGESLSLFDVDAPMKAIGATPKEPLVAFDFESTNEWLGPLKGPVKWVPSVNALVQGQAAFDSTKAVGGYPALAQGPAIMDYTDLLAKTEGADVDPALLNEFKKLAGLKVSLVGALLPPPGVNPGFSIKLKKPPAHIALAAPQGLAVAVDVKPSVHTLVTDYDLDYFVKENLRKYGFTVLKIDHMPGYSFGTAPCHKVGVHVVVPEGVTSQAVFQDVQVALQQCLDLSSPSGVEMKLGWDVYAHDPNAELGPGFPLHTFQYGLEGVANLVSTDLSDLSALMPEKPSWFDDPLKAFTNPYSSAASAAAYAELKVVPRATDEGGDITFHLLKKVRESDVVKIGLDADTLAQKAVAAMADAGDVVPAPATTNFATVPTKLAMAKAISEAEGVPVWTASQAPLTKKEKKAVAAMGVPTSNLETPNWQTHKPIDADDVAAAVDIIKSAHNFSPPTDVCMSPTAAKQLGIDVDNIPHEEKEPRPNDVIKFTGEVPPKALAEFKEKWYQMVAGADNSHLAIDAPSVQALAPDELGPPVFVITLKVPADTPHGQFSKLHKFGQQIDEWMEAHDVQTMTAVLLEGMELDVQPLAEGPAFQKLFEKALHNYLNANKLCLITHEQMMILGGSDGD